jgi:hypothetical protein
MGSAATCIPEDSAIRAISKSYSRSGAQDFAIRWLAETHPELYSSDRDEYHRKLGFLTDFLMDMFPS